MRVNACKKLIILLLSIPIASLSQQQQAEPVSAGSLDPLLYNGRIYSYFVPKSVAGNQFLFSTTFSVEQIRIKGKLYSNCLLNYDIFNQILLLNFKDNTGADRIIEVSKAWLESFTLSGAYFEPVIQDDGEVIFYQVIGNGPTRVLYYYRKEFKLDKSYNPARYAFSPPIRESFVSRNGRLVRYRSNKSFVSIFDPANQEEIKKYLHINKVKVKKASDITMNEVLSFCNEL